MTRNSERILTVNAGSSSLRFALFTAQAPPVRLLQGRIERIGLPSSALTMQRPGEAARTRPVPTSQREAAVETLLQAIAAEVEAADFACVGHRIVHGGPRHLQPCLLTAEIRDELRALVPLDPQHMPFALQLVDAVGREHPALPQVACFDTAFHRDLPRVAQRLPLPQRCFDAGLRRYGFHGLSYTHAVAEIERIAGPTAAAGRLILAHLGNGASLAAVSRGHSLDTTMALTPASGVPMGSRSGDLDPGVVGWLARHEGMSVEAFDDLVNRESGLLGVSGTSADVAVLLQRAGSDPRAAEAIELFCTEVKKRIGAFAAVLGGVDELVFTGGIGENAAAIRERVCDGLGFLGIHLDGARNAAGVAVISMPGASVTIRIIHSDEESVIAAQVVALLAARPPAACPPAERSPAERSPAELAP